MKGTLWVSQNCFLNLFIKTSWHIFQKLCAFWALEVAPTFDVSFLFTIRVQFVHCSLVVIKQVPRISFGFKLFNKPPVYSIPQQIAKPDCKIYNNCCLRSLEYQSGFYSALLNWQNSESFYTLTATLPRG